jgi:hypothetical protein
MGLDQTITFPGEAPAYDQVVDLLTGRGLTVQLRMIDGELAFPDETPSESWQELRVSLGDGMITVRRTDKKVVLVIWGNADRQLVQARNALAWSWAAAGAGKVETATGMVSAEEFARSADLPAAFSSR